MHEGESHPAHCRRYTACPASPCVMHRQSGNSSAYCRVGDRSPTTIGQAVVLACVSEAHTRRGAAKGQARRECAGRGDV
jgi:hypothetical protein